MEPGYRMRASWRWTLILAAASLMGMGCGRTRLTEPRLPPGANYVADGLAFTRQDATPIPMGRTYAVCCSTWEKGYIDRETIKIFFYDATKRSSYWKMFVIPDEVLGDSVFTFPTPTAGVGPVAIFVNDVGTGNEASGEQAASSGTITIHSFSCGPPTQIDATVDAVLASEFAGGNPIRVQGRFTATVYTNSIACVFGF